MKFGCLLFAVQEHDEGKLPDNNPCHSPQCTEFCELVCYLKFTNIPVAATRNTPRQTRSLVMFCKLEGDYVFGAKIAFPGEDCIRLSEYANRHNVRIWCATFPLRCLEVRRIIPSLMRFLLCPNRKCSIRDYYFCRHCEQCGVSRHVGWIPHNESILGKEGTKDMLREQNVAPCYFQFAVQAGLFRWKISTEMGCHRRSYHFTTSFPRNLYLLISSSESTLRVMFTLHQCQQLCRKLLEVTSFCGYSYTALPIMCELNSSTHMVCAQLLVVSALTLYQQVSAGHKNSII